MALRSRLIVTKVACTRLKSYSPQNTATSTRALAVTYKLTIQTGLGPQEVIIQEKWVIQFKSPPRQESCLILRPPESFSLNVSSLINWARLPSFSSSLLDKLFSEASATYCFSVCHAMIWIFVAWIPNPSKSHSIARLPEASSAEKWVHQVTAVGS